MKSNLVTKLNNRTAVIGVLGLGYVGLPLVQRFSEVGYKVIGFDIDQSKITSLKAGRSYIKHIGHEKVAAALAAGFKPTADFSRTREADALIICVPTPLNRYREPDLSYVVNTIEMCRPHLRRGQVVSLESTTYPGTTDEELLPRMESTGMKVGSDLFLVYSPEREDPGNPNFCTRTIPKVCGGYTKDCLEVGIALYGQVIDKVVPVSSTRAAELTKLLENIHRAVNIGLVNEMKIVADRMGIDIHEVIRAAATKPFGFVPYQPGPGLGGHCIPIDPFYLTWKAREFGIHTRFIELAGEVNSSMPEWVVAKITDALNQRQRALNGSSVLILGVAYKKNVDDMRESPAFAIMNLLARKGAQLAYSDPYIPTLKPDEHHSFTLETMELNEGMLSRFDCVVIATNHDDFDYDLIQRASRLIVDTRGVYKSAFDNVVSA